MSWSADTRTGGFTTGQPFRALAANVASQQADPNSLLNFYKSLLGLRKQWPALTRGSYEAPFVRTTLMGFQRALGGQRVQVLINYGKAAASTTLTGLTPGQSLSSVGPGATLSATADSTGQVTLSIPAQRAAVFVLAP